MAMTPDAPSRKTAGDLEHSGYLRANALNLVGAVSIALGSAAPTASLALTLAAIVAVSGYASPVAILVCAIPMLGIAIAYRRLNMWEVNCGGTYVWAGRAISPYFGFMVGWTIILAYWVGAMSIVLPIGTYALQIFHNSYQNSNTASAIIGTAALVFVTGIAYLGIRATARVQILLIAVEYIAISILGILGLIAVFGGDNRSVGFDWSWFSWSSLGGTSGFVAASLIAVYMFSGWDTAILVNEESENPRVTPGTAVILSVLGLAFIYSIFTFALQAAVKPAVLQAHSGDLLTYLGGEYSGSLLAKALIVTVTLSAVGSALACLVSGARVAFAMGFDRVLPAAFGRTHPRHKTPVLGTFAGAAIALTVLWAYSLGSSSTQTIFDTIVSVDGILYALFYAATGVAMAVYYRRLATRSLGGLFELSIFPLASSLFLLYVVYRSVPGLGGWGSRSLEYLYGLMAIGIVLMLVARARRESDYFDLPIEAYDPDATARAADPDG
jgi:amino acid transporter